MTPSLEDRLASAIDRHEAHLIAPLTAQGADPNGRAQGLGMLARALSSDAADCALALLDCGARPNDPRATDSPLSLAIACLGRSRPDVASRLISMGADIEAADTFNARPLQMAIEQGADLVALALIAAGADIEARSTRLDQGALGLSVANGRSRVAQALIERGADLWAPDALGRDPLDIAIEELSSEQRPIFSSMIASARERLELAGCSGAPQAPRSAASRL